MRINSVMSAHNDGDPCFPDSGGGLPVYVLYDVGR